MIDTENFEKIHGYLIYRGQQELAGHLDTMWNELRSLRSDADAEDDVQVGEEDLARIEREKSGFGSK